MQVSLVKQPHVVSLPDFGLCAFESRHAEGFYGELQDPFSKFLLLIAGNASWAFNDRVIEVGPNDLIHIPAGVPHRQRDLPERPVTLYAIVYRPDLLEDLESTFESTLVWHLAGDETQLRSKVQSGFQELLFEQSHQRLGWQIAMRSALSMLAVRLARRLAPVSGPHEDEPQRSPSEERIISYAQSLETTFFRPQTLDDAALATGLSRRQFTALFRKVRGCSWRDHIEQLRLNYAKRLLLETDTSVLAVAFECGFENVASFYRAFKKIHGSTPGAWKVRSRPIRES